MATLVLGTVGRIIGGPLGGIVGTLLGSTIDRGILGGGKTREGPRLANLAVQSAAYGEPLPRLYGRMRVAGNLVWTAGIKETRTRGGGGKSGPATNSYSYSSSFAVIVSSRPILRVERIWADGKLLRTAGGVLNFPATIRVHRGAEDQRVDPLIAAAEGDAAPAYRGRALVVFEDLPLADYGNRIPNLTFEVVADEAEVGIDDIARDVAGLSPAQATFAAVTGFAAAQGGSVRQVLASLADVGDLALHDNGASLGIGGGAAATIAAAATGASDRGAAAAERGQTRGSEAVVPDAVWLTYSDPARDYQSGVQSSTRRSPALRVDRRELPVAVSAAVARTLAEGALRRAIAARTTGRVATGWRYAAIRPGDVVHIGDDPLPWRVTHRTITGALVEFDLDRVAGASAAAVAADPGRVFVGSDAPQGATILHVLDLPALPGPLPTTPRLLLAAGGGAGWRRADVLVSRDGGTSYAVAATISGRATTGTTLGALAPGTTDRWDRRSVLDVELSADTDDLQSASEAAVLAGTNIAVVGDEIVQFSDVEALGGCRFRLSTLLRGRRGTELAARDHRPGERFVLLDERIVLFDLPAETIGAPLLFKAAGAGEDPAALPGIGIVPQAVALRPLSPAHLTVSLAPDGGRRIDWIRRSRAGFAWSDGTDSPIAEDIERYRIQVRDGARVVREALTTVPRWLYDAGEFAGDSANGAALVLAVAQVSASAGSGTAATVSLCPR